QCCRKVWKEHCVCCQVPCTTYVKRKVCTQVPYTVCKKVPYTVTVKVPYTVCHNLVGAYVDEKGVGYDCEAAGRTFKEGAQICTQVPYTVCKMVTEGCKKQIPYTTTKCICGAWVDEKGVGHDCEAPGRTFKECAQVETSWTTTTCRMVQEVCKKQVPY